MVEDLENEIWKPIKGFEGLYEVSNFGRVKSLNYNHTKEEKLLKTDNWKDKRGYHQVFLWKDGVRKNCKRYRLVCFNFHQIPEELKDIPIKELEVNHKDENKDNDRADNLEFCTRKYNVNYGSRTQKVVEKRSKKVYQYDKELNLIQIWKSTMDCGRNGYNSGCVSRCCNGKLPHYKCCIWSYEEIKKPLAS